MKWLELFLSSLILLPLGSVQAQQASGTFEANGQSAALRHAVAHEVDSQTEPGYMDVLIVLSDRPLAAVDARDPERLETLARKEGLAALVVRLNPDAKVMSAEPVHRAFTTFVSSGAFVRWKPTRYDEKGVAGRLWTDGPQEAFRQRWRYDLTFSAPIALDPEAITAPKK